MRSPSRLMLPLTGHLPGALLPASAIPPLSREVPLHPLNNARVDRLDAWPWKAAQRQRCLVAPSGFWEPEKPARAKGTAPWSYCRLKEVQPFFMAGLWSDAADPETGEVADCYTVIITDANMAIRVHDRMPVILLAGAARQWLEPRPLRPELLAPHLVAAMTAWRVGDDAKNSRIEPHPGMAEPIPPD